MRASLIAAAVLTSTVAFASPKGEWREPSETGSISATRDVPAVETHDAEIARAAADRASYRANLTACVSRERSCRKRDLSQEDREYLAWEMKDQVFDPVTVRQVVDVRMTIYGKHLRPVIGQATGPRYSPSSPEPSSAPASTETTGNQILGLTRDVARIAGPMIQRLGAGG